MTDLFSDAAPPPPRPDRVAALACEVSVPVPPEHASAGFAEHIHLWWPAETLSVWGVGSFFDLEDNALVETSADEDEVVWADVSRLAHGGRLEFAWRHQPESGSSTEVTIDFLAAPDNCTTVSLVHDGWSTEESSRAERNVYERFWPIALTKFQRFMGGTA